MTKFFLQLPPNPPHTDGSIKYSKLSTAKSQGHSCHTKQSMVQSG